ncbi:ATP-binding cassette domain-containing protein [Thiospirochaeta perfilievii]|uniref:ATP-binding cassette domain-containing protein n=1 Tax=Thiospirochaeta perfilievii TaxID=252967 RepID=A0A5C1QAH9_9SPIO|nr:ATP-binding cassette domain-containing protein [Thiospirochaeta perfilievii]
MEPDLIELKKLNKKYDSVQAVKDISFSIKPGEIFGLLGPNGAGKSTTIKMIMNILDPDSGQILFDGKKLKASDNEKIGYLPEERGMYKKSTVTEFITYFGMLKGRSIEQLEMEIEKWLTYFDLHDWRYKKTEELSKGMSQKVQFITSIIHDPEIIILDEPFSGLDPLSMDKLRGAILLLKDAGKTIIFSTHVMEQAEKICSHIMILNRGEAAITGSVSEIKSSFGNKMIALEFDGDGSFIEALEEVESIIKYPRYVEVELKDEELADSFLRNIIDKISIKRYERIVPSLHKVFISSIGEDLL